MKKLSLLMASFLFVTLGFGQDIVCAWTFDGLTGTNSGASGTEKVIPSNTEWGAGTFYADGTNGSDNLNNGEGPEINAFNGTTMNDPRTNPSSTKAIAIANSSANEKSVVFKFSMSGYQNLQLSYAERGTSTGFTTETWSYSTNGTDFTTVETISGTNQTNSEFVLRNVDFTAATALNDAAVVYLRLTVDGATNATGNNRIDNVVFRANMAGPDVYAPVITSMSVENATSIKVNFNEALNATTAENGSNYVMAGRTFTAALAGNTVTLTPNPALNEGESYVLYVSNVTDVAGNVMVPDTLSFTFGVSSEFIVNNIAALRAKWTDALDVNGTHFGNDVYKLTGHVIVTGINDSYRHQIFIQDATGAIVIDDPNNKITSALETGDEIADIYGTLTDYFGLLQFAVTEEYTADAISIYNDVTPLTVTLPELQDVNYMNAHQCELIRMEQVTINPLTAATFENGKKYTLTQNGQTGNGMWIHFYNVEGITNEAIPTTPVNLTGVNKISYAEYYLIPRVGADLGTGIAQYLTENDLVVYPNPVADQLTVSLRTDAFQVTSMAVYDLNGKLVKAQSVSDNQIVMNAQSLATGSYFLRLSDGKNSVTTKFVKR